MDDLAEIPPDVMVNWLYQQQQRRMWTNGSAGEGVVLKKSRDTYTACPPDLGDRRGDLFDAMKSLNVRAAITVNTKVIQLVAMSMSADLIAFVPLRDGLRLPILPDVTYLPSCRKDHFSALIRDRAILVVWEDEPKELLTRAVDIEDQLMAMMWKPLGESEGDGIERD